MDLKTAERIARGEDLRPEAERLIAKHRADKKAARARRRSRSPRASGATRADRKAAKREETARLRARVIALANGTCERCGRWPLDSDVGHLHHTLGGSGRRLAEQSVDNCAWLCGACHRHLHENAAAALEFRETLAARRAPARCLFGALVCTHAQCRRTP